MDSIKKEIKLIHEELEDLYLHKYRMDATIKMILMLLQKSNDNNIKQEIENIMNIYLSY